MFARQLTDQISVELAVPFYAEPLFQLTDKNRTYLRRWLPWLDVTTQVSHTRDYLINQMERFAAGQVLCVLIRWEHQLVGVAGFHSIDVVNQIGTIGYWLGEEYTGRGIMTRSVQDLIDIGRTFYSLQRIEIRCATENQRSRAIPMRLGFKHEGTFERAERIYDMWHDHEIYAMVFSR